MAEQLPGGFGQFTREADAAAAAQRSAERAHLHSEAISANQAFDKEARLANAAELNALAELRVAGSKGNEIYHPMTGQLIADKEHIIPGKIDSIRHDERFGSTPKEREKASQQYADLVQKYLDKGYEPAQAELLADSRVEDTTRGIPHLTAGLIATGKKPEEAERTAKDLFAARRSRRDRTVREHGFMTLQDYQTSEEGRKDSFDLNQQTLLTALSLEDRRSQNELVDRLTSRDDRKNPHGLSLADAQLKAKRLYEMKDQARFKAIIENGIDSRRAYNEYLQRRAPGDTAPKADEAETKDIPAVVDEGAKLAPEVDFRDLRDVDGKGLKFTEMIARRNALGGRLPAGEEERFQELREELNGVYPSEKKIEENTALTAEQKDEQKAKLTADLTAEAKELGITLPELTRRLGKFEETQAKYKELGLPTHEDRLPLTGDKLYNMFSADSDLSKYYVGEGGLTPKMQEILVELTKNKGTDVKWFERNGLTFSLVPKAADKKRAKAIAKMVADVNAERKIAVRWIKNEKTGKFDPLTPEEAKKRAAEAKARGEEGVEEDIKERGVGDILLQQFMGNREVSTNTRGRRAARWIGRNLLRLEIPEYQPLPNGGESKKRRLGRVAAGTNVGLDILSPAKPAEVATPEVEAKIAAMTDEQIIGMTPEEARAAFPTNEAYNRYAMERAALGGSELPEDDDTTA